VHPYDDPEVIAGQGTIGFEILKQHARDLYGVFVPVGGGGLIAGIAAYIKQLRPEIRIIGVEPEDADAMDRSLKTGRRVRLDHVGIFADGLRCGRWGRRPSACAGSLWTKCGRHQRRDMRRHQGYLRGPAVCARAGRRPGLRRAQALCGARTAPQPAAIAIASGANVNFDRLRHVAERAEVGERREAILAVTIPERPGSFRQFCSLIGDRNVTEFNYRYADPDQAHVFVGVQVQEAAEVRRLIRDLRSQGYSTLDMTDNEMAKLHIRHLVGDGRPTR